MAYLSRGLGGTLVAYCKENTGCIGFIFYPNANKKGNLKTMEIHTFAKCDANKEPRQCGLNGGNEIY